jgi:heme/copper-type cytochrome/quinol oxidase subunit 2
MELLAIDSFSAMTFGRDIAQFKQLVAFLSLLSIVLWSLVIITTALRMVAYYFWHYRRRKQFKSTGIDTSLLDI